MRWSSQSANGCVPADPMATPCCWATWLTVRRSARSWAPASTVFLTGVVAISQTPSMSSGFTSPSVGTSLRSASSASIEFERSSVSSSTIMSSSSIPRVYEGPVNRCSISRGGYNPCMALGYSGKLYILAFDHRGSFQKKMFGIEGEPTPEQTDTIADAKKVIYEGLLKATEQGVDPH